LLSGILRVLGMLRQSVYLNETRELSRQCSFSAITYSIFLLGLENFQVQAMTLIFVTTIMRFKLAKA
jgi:hypothetical protein